MLNLLSPTGSDVLGHFESRLGLENLESSSANGGLAGSLLKFHSFLKNYSKLGEIFSSMNFINKTLACWYLLKLISQKNVQPISHPKNMNLLIKAIYYLFLYFRATSSSFLRVFLTVTPTVSFTGT